MKKIFFLLLLLFVSFRLSAQDQTNITISGSMLDDVTKETIESGSIRLLNARDSSYVTGTTTDRNGKFKLTVKQSKYILQASFMGFVSKHFNIGAEQKNVNLGKIFLEENSVMLKEAVVTAQAVEILIKGDTVEYNADSYKVQESAVLEDLIKKIPGAEVSAEGKITINGKEISKILVDGKEFFSDDPKIASKNLPAKMIEKLQVLDKRSDMAQLTGFDDGDEETVINLTVKPGMKEGLFGSFLGGYGTKDRYEGNGMINYMRNSTQITVLGGLNNTNNAGFTDFASAGQSGPPRGVSFGADKGVAKTNNLGFNFATEVKNKLKVNGDIRIGSVDNDVRTEREKNYDSQQQRERETSISKGNNKSNNFGTNFKFEWTPDSLTTIIFRPSVQYNKNKSNQISNGTSVYSASHPSSIDYSQDTASYRSETNGIKLSGDLMVNRKLNNKGRTLTFRMSGEYNDSDNEGYDYSSAMFRFNEYPTRLDSTGIVTDQRFLQDDKSYNWRASASYVEPLGRNNFLELEYSFRNNNSSTKKNVYSYDGADYNMPVDSVSRRLENTFITQNVSLSFQSIRKNFNYMVGLGLEPSSTKTDMTYPNTPSKVLPRRNYLNFAPKARFNYSWDKRHTLRIDYRGSTSQASTRQLYDGDYTNTATSVERGNPNLDPSFQNRVFVRYQKFNAERASAFMIFARFNHTLNDIVRVSSWEGAKEVSTYENVNGNMSANTRVIFNTPLKNRKFSVNTMTFASYTRSNSFISQRGSVDFMKNRANRYTLQENLGLRFTSTFLDFTTRGNIAYNRVVNNVSDNDQSVYDYGGYVDFAVHLPFNFHIDSDLTYSANSGYGDAFEKNEWLWNASISKDIFKAKNGTIRVKVYDILKQRSNISWNAGDGYNEYIRTNTINSYVMVNFVYRFQSFKGGVKMTDMQSDQRDRPGGGRSHR